MMSLRSLARTFSVGSLLLMASLLQVSLQASALTSQTITFGALPAKPMSDLTTTVSATASSGLPVVFTTITPTVCTISGTTVTLVSAGTCYVYANQAGDATYSSAPQVLQTFVISKTAQTITFAALPAKLVSDLSTTISATASSGLPITFTTGTPSICTVSATTVTLVAAGTCYLYANQAGNTFYSAAPQITQTFVISKGIQTITFGALGAQAFGATPFTISATATSGLAVSFTSGSTAICTISGVTATIVAAGTCTITAIQSGTANYNAATPVTQSFTVSPLTQTITGFAPTSPIGYVANATFALSATGGASGFPVTFASTTPSICTVAGITATVIGVGTCTLIANQAGNGNYIAAPQVTASVVINPDGVSQTITFGALANKTMSEPPVSLTATASSGLAVTFTGTTPAVCSVAGTTLTLVGVGTCSIVADQVGSIVYSAAAAVTQSFTVAVGAQTIDFAALVDRNLGAPPFEVTASASSALPVVLTSTTSSICTLSGATVTIVAFGTCTIVADQAGNTNYTAAAQVSRSFVVAVMTAQLYYVHADHLGTPRAITRPSDNAVVWKNENTEPFGNSPRNENPSGLGNFEYNLGFPGQYCDKETNICQNWFRDYDPATGRYIQSDPIGLKGGINTYIYVGGMPLSYVDPDGLFPLPGGQPMPGQIVCAINSSCPPPPPPLSCMDRCRLEKLGIMGLSSIGRNVSLSLAKRYGGLAVIAVAGATKTIWTPAALSIGLPYLGFLEDQCQQKCGLQCDGPPNTTFFFAP